MEDSPHRPPNESPNVLYCFPHNDLVEMEICLLMYIGNLCIDLPVLLIS